ncbi:MAG: 4Fe-4S double cluster binding domain-containing protein, partial [Deltaproteobacteria bacterium]
FNLPHRLSAARAGLGTFGKNCLFYSRKAAKKSSWVLPIAVVINRAFEPDEPNFEVGCPDWCRNACIAACPTDALTGPRKLDPTKCISYLTYYGDGITPMEFREPLGLWVYGCDRCQEVCPRNNPWLTTELPINEKALSKEPDFELRRILKMDVEYFNAKIWPHMFYMNSDEIWRWKMNVARVMGNSLDEDYIDDLVDAFNENDDPRVKGMCAWALGKIGGMKARSAVELFLKDAEGEVKVEVEHALDMF